LKRLLVTSIAGYVGQPRVEGAGTNGYAAIVYDDLRFGHADAVKWGPLEAGDVLNPDRLDAVMRRHQPALVMHFAASPIFADPPTIQRGTVATTSSVRSPSSTSRDGTARGGRFSSTCATYACPPPEEQRSERLPRHREICRALRHRRAGALGADRTPTYVNPIEIAGSAARWSWNAIERIALRCR
jgi:UDP-glucose 4-epimerase